MAEVNAHSCFYDTLFIFYSNYYVLFYTEFYAPIRWFIFHARYSILYVFRPLWNYFWLADDTECFKYLRQN